ncbi:MAG: CBS domain-containing protein [Ruminococcaceae bacterium]|nr:CBS domain-containing protein [Oscillospiraceae bacterium]
MNIAYFIKPKNTVQVVYSNNTVRQVIEKMKYYGYSAIPVLTEDGKYFGTVTEGDLLWATYMKDPKSCEKTGIASIIKADRCKPLSILASADELIEVITVQNFAPVLDDRGYFMGIVTRRDVIKYYYNKLKSEKQNHNQ